MTRPVTRVQPVGPPQAYKTYEVKTPLSHTRPATCAEVNCEPHLRGWATKLFVSQTRLINTVRKSGRPFKESTDGQTITFVFEPGLACFKAHKHRVQERPELYVVRGGDYRGNPTRQLTTHTKPEFWVEDFAEHQQKIIREMERG